MNGVSKCAEIKFSSFDNLHFPLEIVTIEMWVLKATVRKFLLSSLVFLSFIFYYHFTTETYTNVTIRNIAKYVED